MCIRDSFYILEALKRGFEFEELLDLSKLAPVYLQVLANLVAMEKAAEVATSPAFLPVEPSAGLYEVKAGAAYYPVSYTHLDVYKRQLLHHFV